MSDAQTIDKAYWRHYRHMADSVVISRFGEEVFERYIFTEERIQHDLSDLIVVTLDSVLAWSDQQWVTSPPLWCQFEYEIALDPSEGGPTIAFSLDPLGHHPQDEPIRGLPIPTKGRSGFAMAIKAFERTALDSGFHWGRTDRYRLLEWTAPSDSLLAKRGDIYELTLGRIVGNGAEYAHGSAYLFDIVEGITFDVFTGEVRRQGIFQVATGIACGVRTL